MKKTTKLTLTALFATLLVAVPRTSQSDGAVKAKMKKIVLSKDNIISLNDVIAGESVAEVITKAKALDNSGNLMRAMGAKNKEPIYIFLRSPGGEVQTGIEMLEALKGLNRPVDTITMFAASMAFQVAQQLGKRYIVKNGVLMSHRATGGFEGEFGGQRPNQIDSRKALWEARLDEMDQATVDRTNGKQTLASYQKAYSSELWLTGSQAVEQGYADEVVSVNCDSSLSGVTTKSVSLLGGMIQVYYDLDNCPLNSAIMNVHMKITTNKGVKNLDDFLADGGEFGSSCLTTSGTNPAKLCAIDTSLTLERINQIKIQFKYQYENIKSRVTPYGL